MIEIPTIHKRLTNSTKTKCGLKLSDIRHTGMWKYTTCTECLKHRYYTPKRSKPKMLEAVKIEEVDIKKINTFFNKTKKNEVKILEEFL